MIGTMPRGTHEFVFVKNFSTFPFHQGLEELATIGTFVSIQFLPFALGSNNFVVLEGWLSSSSGSGCRSLLWFVGWLYPWKRRGVWIGRTDQRQRRIGLVLVLRIAVVISGVALAGFLLHKGTGGPIGNPSATTITSSSSRNGLVLFLLPHCVLVPVVRINGLQDALGTRRHTTTSIVWAWHVRSWSRLDGGCGGRCFGRKRRRRRQRRRTYR